MSAMNFAGECTTGAAYGAASLQSTESHPLMRRGATGTWPRPWLNLPCPSCLCDLIMTLISLWGWSRLETGGQAVICAS